MSSARVRAYEPARDGSPALALWDACLDPAWPIDRSAFHRILASGDHLVAEERGRLVGFAAARSHGERGGILVLLVDPGHQRRGLGRALHDRALDGLRAAGVRRVRLGAAGHGDNFWAGVPVDLPDAWAFFERAGWTSHERVTDEVVDLSTYATPPAVHAPASAAGIAVAPAHAADAASVVAFAGTHFGGWDELFAAAFGSGESDDVLVARGPGGTIQGLVLIHGPDARWHGPLRWAHRLGPGTGAIGAIGVAEAARGNGTGLALLARATETLKERGLARSYAAGTGISLAADPVSMSLRDLCTAMLSVSDNAATDAVLAAVGKDAVNERLRRLGCHSTVLTESIQESIDALARDMGYTDYTTLLRAQAGEFGAEAQAAATDQERIGASRIVDPTRATRTTARDMTRLLATVWADQAAAPRACASLRTAMSQQLTRRLAVAVPSGGSLAAKTGALLGRVRNEVAVIGTAEGGAYAVAVLTRPHQPFVGVPAIDHAMGLAVKTAIDRLETR